MADGSAFDYSGVDPGADMQKLMDAIQAVDSGDPPLCGVEADLPHIHAVRLVQQNPITPVRSELVQPVHTDTDDFYCVKNLEQMLVHCAENRHCPPSWGFSWVDSAPFQQIYKGRPRLACLCKLRHRCHMKFHSRFLDWVSRRAAGRGRDRMNLFSPCPAAAYVTCPWLWQV